jgi:hypothetical protein
MKSVIPHRNYPNHGDLEGLNVKMGKNLENPGGAKCD